VIDYKTNPSIFISFYSFVDDGFFILQEKTYVKSNALLFCSYSIITSLFDQFRLATEHGKLKNFHFSRSTRNFNPSLLNLSPVEGLLLQPKNI